MRLQTELLRRLDDSALSLSERAQLRCALAKELEDGGSYEAARGALGALWQGIGSRPLLDGLEAPAAAEVLLRVGTLTGWIGSARQIPGAQEAAKDLLSEAADRFLSLDRLEKVIECRVELAYCYWREGAIDEARLLLQEAIDHLEDGDLRALAILRRAIVETTAGRPHDALRLLTGAAALFEASAGHALKGKFHNELATILENLGAAENRADFTDQAFVEYTAASYHFEQAGHLRYRAYVENNLGFLYYKTGRYSEANGPLSSARRLFESLKDAGSVAQVDETRARVLLAQGRYAEAERVVRGAVSTLEKGGEAALLAEALTTRGAALARLGRAQEARAMLERAIHVAEVAGAQEGAGRAALTIIEELAEHLAPAELSDAFERADRRVASTQHAETKARLLACARRVIAAHRSPRSVQQAPIFVHASDKISTLLKMAERVAPTGRAALITGETGTGKEVLARFIHQRSGRTGRFVAVNCAALNEQLIESQLFGHRKGSFTDAQADYMGAALEAMGGTLFLDEIGELTLAMQAKLLRLVEYGEVRAVGGTETERVDVRIVAATNRNLRLMVAQGKFREDLYYRLATFNLEIPPLRERPEDITALAAHFISTLEASYRKRLIWPRQTLERLKCLPLPGNARELRALVERAIVTAEDGEEAQLEGIAQQAIRVTAGDDPVEPWQDCDFMAEVQRFEAELIRRALAASGNQVSGAARRLNLSHQTLSYVLNHRHRALRDELGSRPRLKSIVQRKADKLKDQSVVVSERSVRFSRV